MCCKAPYFDPCTIYSDGSTTLSHPAWLLELGYTTEEAECLLPLTLPDMEMIFRRAITEKLKPPSYFVKGVLKAQGNPGFSTAWTTFAFAEPNALLTFRRRICSGSSHMRWLSLGSTPMA